MRNTFNICSLSNADFYRAMKIARKRIAAQSRRSPFYELVEFEIPELTKYGVPPFKGLAIV